MPNPFAHIELSTDDVKKAKKFYQAVFAWKLNDMPAMAYTMIDVGGGVGGGMQKKQMPDAPNAWLPYVLVDDVKATIAKAVKAGGTAILPFQEIGEMGAIGIFTDPAGAALGLWEESKTAPPPSAPPAAKKASVPAKKAPAKKASAAAPAAAPAKKAPAKKEKASAPAAAPAKKAAAKKAPVKKAAPAPAPVPAKKAPAKKK